MSCLPFQTDITLITISFTSSLFLVRLHDFMARTVEGFLSSLLLKGPPSNAAAAGILEHINRTPATYGCHTSGHSGPHHFCWRVLNIEVSRPIGTRMSPI